MNFQAETLEPLSAKTPNSDVG